MLLSWEFFCVKQLSRAHSFEASMALESMQWREDPSLLQEENLSLALTGPISVTRPLLDQVATEAKNRGKYIINGLLTFVE